METDGAGAFWRFIRPKSVLEYWTAVTFVIAVAQLFLFGGLGWNALVVMFVAPPVLAYAAAKGSDRLSTRLLGASFLTMMDLGEVIAAIDCLFPNLRAMSQLSGTSGRFIAWYLVLYLTYPFCLMPPVFFIRDLRDRRQGRPALFSRFTCILGLSAWVIIGPPMIAVIVRALGLWPLFACP